MLAMRVSTQKPKVKLYGLVRDKNGVPKFDNFEDVPLPIWNMMTYEEQQKELQNGRNPCSNIT